MIRGANASCDIIGVWLASSIVPVLQTKAMTEMTKKNIDLQNVFKLELMIFIPKKYDGLTMQAMLLASLETPRRSKKCLSLFSGLPRKTCNKQDSVVTFMGATTYMSPFRSSTSRSHHTETNNIDTTIKKTHKCTYQGQKRCISRHRIMRCTWNLQNSQDGSEKELSSETLHHNLEINELKLTKGVEPK